MPQAQLNKRVLIFSIILALTALVLLIQYASVMLVALPANGGKSSQPLERGPILDRNGRILALQTTVYTLSAWPENMQDPFQTAHILAPILGMGEEKVRESFGSGTKARIVKTRISQSTADQLAKVIDEKNLQGLLLEPESSRTYPEKTSAAHVIGFTGKDNVGLEGLEYRFNDVLSSQQTIMADGKAYGNQLELTLDTVIQESMEKIAAQVQKDSAAQGVILYVMDSQTGEILAYVNQPSFDPNKYQAYTAEQRRNLGTGFTYEPGSVFKIFTLAAIMSRGRIDENTQFMTSPGYRNKLFRDPITDLADYGTITPEGIIVHSSNVGAALASDTVTGEEFHQDLENFGFGKPTGIEMPGEEKGLLKAAAQWTPRTKPTLAFGQEISVTALQMLQAATVIANDGTMLKPQIVRRILSPQGQVIKDFAPIQIRQVITPKTARALRSYMNAATGEGGTGHRSRVEGINLSVKTGTAQMLDPKNGRYSSTDYVASSLGMFPSEAPQLIVYAVIIRPRGKIYGGQIAAPMIKSAAEFLIPYLGIAREGDRVLTQSPQIQIRIPRLPALKDRVPRYIGLPLRTVMELHKNKDIQTVIVGSGFVVSQNPQAGSPVTKNMTITLTLSDAAPAAAAQSHENPEPVPEEASAQTEADTGAGE